MDFEFRDTRTFEGFKKFTDPYAFEIPYWFDIPEDDYGSFISDLNIENQQRIFNDNKGKEVKAYFYGDDGERFEDILLIQELHIVSFVTEEYRDYYVEAKGVEECREFLEKEKIQYQNKLNDINRMLKEVK